MASKDLTETPAQTAKRIAEDARMKAAVTIPMLMERLNLRALDENAKFADLKDAVEYNLKVAGRFYDSKQVEQPQQQQQWSLTINLDSGIAGNLRHPKVVTLEQSTVEVAEDTPQLRAVAADDDFLSQPIPTHLLELTHAPTSNLSGQ